MKTDPDRRCGTCRDWSREHAKPSNIETAMISHCFSDKPDSTDSVRPESLRSNNTRMKMYSFEGQTCPAWQPKKEQPHD